MWGSPLKRAGAGTKRADCVYIKLLAVTLVKRLDMENLKEKALSFNNSASHLCILAP